MIKKVLKTNTVNLIETTEMGKIMCNIQGLTCKDIMSTLSIIRETLGQHVSNVNMKAAL